MNTSISVVANPFFVGRLPIPPGINHSYQIVTTWTQSGPKGRLADTPALALFKQEAGYVLCEATYDYALINAIRMSKKRTPLAISLKVYFPKPTKRHRKRDTDGVMKHVIDAVFQKLELNDELVDHIEVDREYVDADPRIEIAVRCILTGE